MVIAIDGPSGVGKSTVSRAVASKLGLAYLDTGATYRAATLAALNAGVDMTDEIGVLAELELHSVDYDERGVLLDGESVAFSVRSDAVTSSVSVVSAHPLVRAATVTRRLTDGLLVEVTERTPVALAPTPTLEPIDAENILRRPTERRCLRGPFVGKPASGIHGLSPAPFRYI